MDEERSKGDEPSNLNDKQDSDVITRSAAENATSKNAGGSSPALGSEETRVGSTETIVGGSAQEAKVSEASATASGAANAAQNSKDEDPDRGGGGESGNRRNNTGLIVVGIILVILLIIIGLFLPPISLGERLGLTGNDEAETTAADDEQGQEVAVSDSLTLSLSSGDSDVKVEQLDSAAFLEGNAGKEWQDASEALPARLSLVSDVYALEFAQERPPFGSAAIQAPAEAQPFHTLDLFGWDGTAWFFMPSEVDDQDSLVISEAAWLPTAVALMQTRPAAELEIGAEVLPTQSLPPTVLPFLTEVTAGTLTLGPNGSLLGEAAAAPSGDYRQLLRATNTGAIIDIPSLATMLADPAAQDQNIEELVNAVMAGGFDGINLDYQGVPVEMKGKFTEFNRALSEQLHAQGLDLVVTLETPILLDGEWNTAGQDWAALGAIADAVYPQMPLDPREYGDAQLAEQIVSYATRQIDRSKLTMLNSVNTVDSVANVHREIEQMEALEEFGEITFIEGSEEVEPGDVVEVALSGTASALAWDPASLTYQYSYEQADQEHQVWLGSEALLSHRGRFTDRYNLRGLAVRGLGNIKPADGYAKALASLVGADEPPQPASAAVVWTVEDGSGAIVASSTGEEMYFNWVAPEKSGDYLVQAKFAQGDTVSDLASQSIIVAQLLAEAEPEPTEEPEEEAAPTPETAAAPSQPSAVDPGDSDAVANTPSNVRSGPGLGYGIIGGVQTGQKVKLIGRNEDASWLNIEMGDGSKGWVFAQLLTVNSTVNVNALAEIEVEPPTVASSGGGTGSAPPPVIAPAGGGSFELGGQTHSLANPTLMKSAGMNWVKFQHKWGPGDSPDGVGGRIQQAHANGLKVLLSIPGGSSYPSSIDFNSYVEFLRGVAAFGPDAIEIWNEMNIDFEWPAGQIDPASYVNNMLAPAYNAIKSANSSVMVISGAPAPTGFDNGTNAWSDARYMAGVAAAGGGNYMDCIGVHHNAGATSPNAQSGHPAGGTHYSWYFFPTLNMYYNTFGGARPVCFTELGYLSGQDFGGVPARFSWAANTTVGQHAQWLAEAASLSANSGKVRLMIVFNVDFTHWGDDPQAGYAMLRPDGSCPSCGLLGQVMGR